MFKQDSDPVVMEDPVIKEIAEKHSATPAQVSLKSIDLSHLLICTYSWFVAHVMFKLSISRGTLCYIVRIVIQQTISYALYRLSLLPDINQDHGANNDMTLKPM